MVEPYPNVAVATAVPPFELKVMVCELTVHWAVTSRSSSVLKQLFATRKNFQKAELEIQSLKTRLSQLQEALTVMQAVVAEGLK